MNWNDFESNVRETLEIEDDVVIDKNELLENSEYWSSMHALLIMALAESEYDISITGEELRNSKTLQDLFNLFESKVA
jgi:acyl carrier protein